MNSTEGDIKLGVELEPKDVKKSAQTLQKEIEKVFDASAGKGAEESFKRIESRMSKASVKAKEFHKVIEELENTQIPTQQYEEISKQIQSARDEISKFEVKQDELITKRAVLQEKLASGSVVSKEESKSLGNQIAKLNIQITGIDKKIKETTQTVAATKNDLQELVDSGKAFTLGSDSAEFEDAVQGLNDCNNEMRVLLAQASNYSIVTDETGQHIERNKEKINSIIGSIGSITEESRKPIESVEELESAMSEVERQVRNIGIDLDTVDLEKKNSDVETLNVATQEIQDHVNNTSHSLENVIADMQSLVDSGKLSAEAAAELESRIEEADHALQQSAQDAEILSQIINRSTSSSVSLVDSMKMLPSIFGEGFIQLLELIPETLAKIGSAARTAALHLGNMAKKLLSMAGGAIKRGLSNLVKHIRNINSASSKAGISIKNLIKAGIGIASVAVLFRKLKSAIQEGISNLAHFNGGANSTNAAMSSLISSLNYLKNAWGAAFAPILNFVAPVLSRLIDMLASVANKIAAFMAAIAGATSFTRAKKTNTNYAAGSGGSSGGKSAQEKYEEAQKKAQEKYEKDLAKVQEQRANAAAKAEEKQAKAAAKLAKEQEKANGQLQAFDELNVITTDALDDLEDAYDIPEFEDPILEEVNWDDFAGGAGDAFSDMFEEVPLELDDWMQQILDLIKSKDWEGLGRFIADQLNAGMKLVDDFINNVFRPMGVEIATAIAEFGNGLVDQFDWQLLGKTIADGLNAIADIFNTFLTTFDFENLGSGIGTAIKSWFDNVEWELIATTFANKWNALIDIIHGIVTTPGIWESMATAVSTFVNTWFDSIKWGQAVEAFTVGFNGLLKAIRSILSNINFGEMGEELGDRVIQLVEDINWEDVSGVVSDIFSSLFDFVLMVDWATLGTDLGIALADLLAGVDWIGLMGKLGALLDELIIGAIEVLFGLLGELSVKLGEFFEELGLDGIAGFLKGLGDGIKGIARWIQTHIFDPVVTAVRDLFGIHSPSTVFAEFGQMLIEGLKQGIIDAWTAFLEAITEKVEALKQLFLDAWNNIKANVVELWNTITNGIMEKINSLKEKISIAVDNMKQVFTDMKDTVISVFESMWDNIKGVVNSILSGVESMANGVINAFNSMIGAINALHFDIPDWVPFLGGNSLGFNLSTLGSISIPKLAQGAVIPPNSQFLAMLGDQKSGTNIEAPLDTIKQALAETLADIGMTQNNDNSDIVINIDGREIFRVIRDQDSMYRKSNGESAFAYGGI